MLYTKNDDKRYTMMCKEFDDEFWKPERDDNKLYKYMYLLFYMLACKENYFQNNYVHYDKFAQYAATTIYVRFLKKLSKGEIIKSLLNYAHTSIEHLKISYQNEEFDTIITPKQCNTTKIAANMHSSIVADYDDGLTEDIENALLSVDDIINDVLDNSLYANKKLIRHRVYISCLLTLLSSITLPRDSYLLKTRGKNKNTNDVALIEALKNEREKSIVLWNLPEDKREQNIIRVITNKIRKDLSEVINEVSHEHTLPDDVVDLILANAYSEGKVCIEKEEDYD